MSRSVLIPKNGGTSHRPLAIGDPFYRILGKILAGYLKVDCEGIFSPEQLGCGVRGGAEKVGRLAQLCLESDPTVHAVSLDISNAFSNISRSAVYKELRAHFPGLVPVFEWVYGRGVRLFDSTGRELLQVEEGVQQGDPLSSLYFCLAFQPVLKEIETEIVSKHTTNISRNRGVFRGGVAAHMDDVTLLVRSDQVDISIETARRILDDNKLSLNMAKSVVIKGRGDSAYSGATTTRGTAKLLGMPVGHDENERNLFFLQMKERIAQDLRALEGADVGLFVKFNLLRSPVNTLPGFLTRVCEPSENFQSSADSVDAMVDGFIDKLLGTQFQALNESVHATSEN
mmetsp:Transcript_21539/g.23479  ORF Transcript_21539/g.23479 Transcript_21539/m.23479 type:complete len:342 (+) Transcript_21539:1232-2257(+)